MLAMQEVQNWTVPYLTEPLASLTGSGPCPLSTLETWEDSVQVNQLLTPITRQVELFHFA